MCACVSLLHHPLVRALTWDAETRVQPLVSLIHSSVIRAEQAPITGIWAMGRGISWLLLDMTDEPKDRETNRLPTEPLSQSTEKNSPKPDVKLCRGVVVVLAVHVGTLLPRAPGGLLG